MSESWELDDREEEPSADGLDAESIARRARFIARAPMLLKLVGFVALVSVFTWVALHPNELRPYLAGEVSWDGERVFDPPHALPEPTPDFARVHEKLLPRWIVARNERAQDARLGLTHARASGAHRAFARLRYELSVDPNMVYLVDELERALRDNPVENAQRIDYLLWAYNHYLDRVKAPWRIEASMIRRPRASPVFATTSYRVLRDLESEQHERLRLLARADLTNLVESYLGHSTTRDEGALVMMDRVMHFAVRHVWPALHPGLDDRLPPGERALARYVRREASLTLSPDLLVVLHETAVDQLALIEVAASIHARHERCGSRFQVYGLPWNGLSPADRRAIVDGLDRSRGRECPEVTLGEAARMIGASERLASESDLIDAVEELVTWVAQAVAVHELRHIRDGEEIECAECPDELTSDAQKELSAYLASFRSRGAGYVALMQACALEVDNEAMQILGPHEQALALALAHLMPNGCVGAPPADLYERAHELETSLFRERDEVALPADYPQHVHLLGRAAPQLARQATTSPP